MLIKSEDILLSVTKSIRTFIFMSLSITIPFFLTYLGYDPLDVSLVLLVAIGVSTFYIYFYSLLKIDIKKKLLLMGFLLVISLAFLYIYETLPGLIAALVIGAISLSGKDMATNQSLEQYTIGMVERDQRAKNFAFSLYNFLSYGSGAAASAFLYLTETQNFRLIFITVLGLAIAQVAIYSVLKFPALNRADTQVKANSETKRKIHTLSSLFFVDSVGGGLVNTSIITLWFEVVYHVTLSQAGLIFIGVNIITAGSIIISGYLSSSIGLVRTMVYTHVISNIFLFFIPVFHFLIWSEALLFIRQSTSQMDVPARDSFVNTIIPEESRVGGNSSFLAYRNAGQVPGPGLAGILFEVFPSGIFITAALTKIAYDLTFYFKFRSVHT